MEPESKHSCSGSEFLDAFCVDEDRQVYYNAITDIFNYAKMKGARRIFVGGSFIDLTRQPSDFDCLIVFNRVYDVPDFIDSSIMGDLAFDILYASEDEPNIVDAFIDLFKSTRDGLDNHPVVEVILNSRFKEWVVTYNPSNNERAIISNAYKRRTVIERRKSRGLLITIHGVNTKAFWNSRFAPLACSQGWIFAPFIYNNPIWLLFSKSERDKVLRKFNEYFFEVCTRYEASRVSVVAHSFGTYIIAKFLLNYLKDNNFTAMIDSIVLTGGIVDSDYDWSAYYPEKVGRILNFSTKNDKWVRLMPYSNKIKQYLMSDSDGIFGKCGYSGLNTVEKYPQFIRNKESQFLTHTNPLENVMLEGEIMPFLNANVGVCEREYFNQ